MADWETLLDFNVLDVRLTKYRSKKTGLKLCLAAVEGPLVNGFLTLATETHDDDGLPHTLEHLIFMGSEEYPAKGVLDLLANRCLAQGTNAWTDVDHTCYTMTTAGSDGFLTLLPIYLDHVLYPTLTDSAFITEVHHVNEEGEDAGIVYCEMQARENSGESRCHLAMLRALYPGHCGFKSETGGIMANLRDSCNNMKVRQYHKEYYRPDNLCLIITGQVEAENLFKAIQPFEEKILQKGALPPMACPWSSPVPPFSDAVEQLVQFPSDDTSTGLIRFGWRGPLATDHVGLASVQVLWEYLTDTAVSPLQRDLVEIPDPYCSKVQQHQSVFTVTCSYLSLTNVPFEKLRTAKSKVEEILGNIATGKEAIDMKRMESVVHRQVLHELDKLEDSGHETFAFLCIGDFLYSQDKDELKIRSNQLGILKSLKSKSADYWTSLLNQYFVSAPSVVIIGEPSSELSLSMQADEKARIQAQRTLLGEEGLKKKEEELEKATEENDVEPPDDLLSSVSVPSTDKINFHPLVSYTNRHGDVGPDQFPLNKMPFQFQIDDIHTSFVQVTALLDTAVVSDQLRPYLTLLTELLCVSPIIRNGEFIPHDQVVAQLAADTLFSESSVGIDGHCFRPGSFPQLVTLCIKVEAEKYEQGVEWLQELLYQTQFTAERIEIIAKKMLNDITSLKRKGRMIVRALSDDLNFASESNLESSSFLKQQPFLTSVLQQLEKDPNQVSDNLDRVCSLLSHPENLRVHAAADLKRLPPNGHLAWDKFLARQSFQASSGSLCLKPIHPSSSLLKNLGSSLVNGSIVGVGSVESSFLMQTCRSINSYTSPDLPALMVFLQYICALEGPMWKQVRGLGLAYHYKSVSHLIG
jgi:Zn-dependent M16 (insulinase) family peptidase